MTLDARPGTDSTLIAPERAREIPTMVVTELRTLQTERQADFLEEYERRRKGSLPAWLLWAIGWHFAYFGEWGLQVVYILTAAGAGVWWVVEAFKLPRRLRNQRRDVAIAALRDLKAISGRAVEV